MSLSECKEYHVIPLDLSNTNKLVLQDKNVVNCDIFVQATTFPSPLWKKSCWANANALNIVAKTAWYVANVFTQGSSLESMLKTKDAETEPKAESKHKLKQSASLRRIFYNPLRRWCALLNKDMAYIYSKFGKHLMTIKTSHYKSLILREY